MKRPTGDIWVFGYGSLMWRPGFAYTESQPALLRGYPRSLCIYSIQYRGSYERPGSLRSHNSHSPGPFQERLQRHRDANAGERARRRDAPGRVCFSKLEGPPDN